MLRLGGFCIWTLDSRDWLPRTEANLHDGEMLFGKAKKARLSFIVFSFFFCPFLKLSIRVCLVKVWLEECSLGFFAIIKSRS